MFTSCDAAMAVSTPDRREVNWRIVLTSTMPVPSAGYTATRRPVTLVYSEYFDRIVDAVSAERQIKRWSRGKKEALIRRDYEALKVLAGRRS
jgi:hypothetical protein